MKALILVLLLMTSPAYAQGLRIEQGVLFGALPVFVGLAGADAYGTVQCVERGTCHEANPLIRPFVDRHGIRLAMAGKVGVNVGMAGGMLWLQHRYPEHTRALMFASLGLVVVQGYVVVQNYHTLNQGVVKQ